MIPTVPPIRPLTVAALAAVLLAGCASTRSAPAASACGAGDAAARTSVEAARAGIEAARETGAETHEARDLLQQAKAALAECDTTQALHLARAAELEATEAIVAWRREQARGRQARTADRTYSVTTGDTLWAIAASTIGYGDPYQWPLIYRTNADRILDPDLIYPGQTLVIEADPAAQAISTAIEHARARGAWSLGAIEPADGRYLARSKTPGQS